MYWSPDFSPAKSTSSVCRDWFRQGLRELGYTEGQNVAIECRFADGQLQLLRKLVAELLRLDPDVIWTHSITAAGGLLACGPKLSEFSWRRAAIFVDKILKGATPADLPVEQPTTIDLVVNLKAAKQLGVRIPPSMLTRADKVIK